jgi:GGDEF domain-containing protein
MRHMSRELKRVRRFAGEPSHLTHLGGEDLAVVLEGKKLTGARACAELLGQTIENSPIDTSADPGRITVSIGISGPQGSGNSAADQSQFKQPDVSHCASKANGQHCISSPYSNRADVGARQSTTQWTNNVKPKAAVSPVR